MAVDLEKMISNLLEFYDFTNKVVLSIGAGGGQCYEYAFNAKHVIAVDNNIHGIESLGESLLKEGILDKFTLVHSDFYDFKVEGNLLMFDYCLHEITNPKEAIRHALSMSAEILINDHWPGSEWAYFTDEDVAVRKSWQAIQGIKIHKIERFDTFQIFQDYDELFQKVKGQGDNSKKRIEKYRSKKNITIPMSYGLALIRRTDNEILN